MTEIGSSTCVADKFNEIREPYAAGLFEFPDRALFCRYARAQQRFWETVKLPDYNGGPLYPCGKKYPERFAVAPDYSYTCSIDWEMLASKWGDAETHLKSFAIFYTGAGPVHTVGGDGYTHSIPHYERVAGEGLDSYVSRINALPDGDFKDGCRMIIDGIRFYRDRCVALLEVNNAPKKLRGALARVPFAPAADFYEALVCWNFIYYIDGCDNPGRIDSGLFPYYGGERDADDLLRAFFQNVDCNDGWSAAIGPEYNALTLGCLRAIRGMRRPSLELRVVPDMPDEIWRAAAEALATGCGQPALYNEPLYQSSLAERFPEIPAKDLLRFNGGGCTETMLAGVSNVGSLDAGVNLLAVFERFLRERLADYNDFQSFYAAYLDEIKAAVCGVLQKINGYQEKRAALRPHPVRTILVDDCIDKGADFNAGGARYYWSVVNVAGLVNVIDSLFALKHLVFDTGQYTAGGFMDALMSQDAGFLADIGGAPRFGDGNGEADLFAGKFAGRVFDFFELMNPLLGGKFLPASIQFTTYADAGKNIGPTPDGRAAGAPLADSIAPARNFAAVPARNMAAGPAYSTAAAGPTAMLSSAARLPQYKALGTPVLNLRLLKSAVINALKPLILGYFSQGGMHAQISCYSREDLEAAMAHPETHNDLIVRIGGYSEYFSRLSGDLKRSVLERCEYSV